MSAIKGKDTTPERALRLALWKTGLRYRLRKDVFGKPDLVFPGSKEAVFVDGCFWHGCPDHYVRPQKNRQFWDAKIAKNTERDMEVTKRLIADGWRVLRFWEHEVKSEIECCIERVAVALGKTLKCNVPSSR